MVLRCWAGMADMPADPTQTPATGTLTGHEASDAPIGAPIGSLPGMTCMLVVMADDAGLLGGATAVPWLAPSPKPVAGHAGGIKPAAALACGA